MIYNPVAGRHPVRRHGEIRSATAVLRSAGFDLEVEQTTGPGSARDIARSASQADVRTVFVCGGDGTINEVVNGLALTSCRMGILPGGTANIAGRDLGLALNPVTAALELQRSQLRRIALGRVTWGRSKSPAKGAAAAETGSAPRNARYFLSVAGVGFDAYVVHNLGWDFKRDFGVTAYVWKAIEQVWRYGFPPFLCRTGDAEWRGRMALVQRSERYAGWLHMSPGSSLLNPRMKLFLFEGKSAWRYLFYSLVVALRRHLRLHDLRVEDRWPLECTPDGAAKPIRVELDGEAAGELPATFELVPDALLLMLPERLA